MREIGVFPVKSTGGLSPTSTTIGPDGLTGDRAHAVVDAAGTVLRAKHHPALSGLRLTGPAHSPRLQVPGGVPLDRFLGVPGAHLAPVAGGARQVEAVHLVSLRQRLAPGAGDTSRANLVVELQDEPDVADWVGATCRVGPVELEVVGVPRHCAGVFARVRTPGTVHVGDVAELVPGTHG
nr:MOSC N-terminal beta barrel domain-containing protein [Kineococcus aurantiacus]